MARQQTTRLPSAVLAPADGEQLLSEKDDRIQSNTPDWELMHEEPPKPVIKRVPKWFYTTRGVCSLNMAASLWWANLAGAILHTLLMIVSVAVSMQDGNFGTPTVSVYLTKLSWVDSSDPFLPMYQKTTSIALPVLVTLFFFLSALAHTTICALNWKQAFATGFCENVFDADKSKVTDFTGWYYVNLHQCRNPLRFAEYSFSASVMALVFAAVSGVSHAYMLTMLFALIWTTMTFGHFAERVCPPKDLGNDTRPKYWLVNNSNPHLLWAPYFNGKFHRLFWHVLGYYPYLSAWTCLLHSFFHTAANAPEGGGPPSFVYAIIIGQFLLFSLFGVTQAVLLFREDGAFHYVWGEMSYILLSLVAKAFLGLMLIANVLMYSSLEESMD